jgi:hypothetical protein
MSKTATLASGQISPTNKLLVELREPEELPASILITWPQAPSVVDPHRFGATANAVARLMATAITTLAQIRAYEPEQEKNSRVFLQSATCRSAIMWDTSERPATILAVAGSPTCPGHFQNRNDRQPRSLGRAPVGAPSKS